MDGSAKQVAAIVGPRIRRIRRGLDMSQENLADNAGINRTQISFIEHGEQLPRIDTMIKLAGGLGITPGELLDGIFWEVGGGRPGKLVVTGNVGDGRGSAGTGGDDA